MKGTRFGIDERVVPVLAPQDITSTDTDTSWVDLKGVLHATFLTFFGNIAATSADQGVVVTLLCATGAATTGEVALAFNYRLSGAVATDTLGDITAATSSGVTVATTDDNSLLYIDVDPAALEAALADGRFVRLNIAPDAGGSATLIAGLCVIENAYASVTEISAS